MQPMQLYSDSTTALDRIEALVAELKQLRQLILENEDGIRVDAMFNIGLRRSAKVTRTEPIRVEPLHGEEAFHAAVDALTDLEFRDGQVPRETFRAPGVLAVPRLIYGQILKTNRMRKQLSRLIAKIKPQSARREVWAKHSDLCPKHVLRNIPTLKNPRNINFYWSTGFTGKTYIASDLLDEWKQYLEEIINGEGMLLNSYNPITQSLLEARIKELEDACSPSAKVTIKRPVAPHVRARVSAARLKRDHTAVVAPIPFVYCLVDGVPPPEIKPLPDYDPKKPTRKASKRILVTKVLVTGAHVYGYE